MSEPFHPSGFRTQNRKVVIALLVLVALAYWISMYLFMPTLPTYVKSKTDNLALVGVILAQYGLWQAIIRLPLGITADWLGRRKPFILIGVLMTGLGAWLLGTADGGTQLIVARAITGLGAGTWVPLMVAFSSLFPPRDVIRATAFLTFIGSVGRILGTSFTGTLNELGGYQLAFMLAAGAGVVGALLLLPIREEPLPVRRPSVQGIGRLVLRRDVLLPSLLSAVSQYINWSGSFGFLPILAEGLGATDVSLSLLTSLHIVVVTVMTLGAATLVNRVGAKPLVVASFVLATGGMALASAAPTLTWVFVAQFLMGMAQGFGYSTLMGWSIQDVPLAEQNTAMGLHQAVYAIGMFAGPWLSGILADAMGLRPMFGVTAFVCLALSMFLIRLLPTPK